MTVGIVYLADDNKIRIRRPFGSDEWLFEVFENGLWQELSRLERFDAAKKAVEMYKRDKEAYVRYLR